MSLNIFPGVPQSDIGPARDLEIVTPNDNADLPRVARALAVDGAVRVTTIQGNVIDLPNFGFWRWDCEIVRVHATGTDATEIVAYY